MKKTLLFILGSLFLLPALSLASSINDSTPTSDAITIFKVWKTVTLGAHKSADGYRTAIDAEGQTICSWADSMLNVQPTFPYPKREISLVNLSVTELGLEGGATYEEIMKRAEELGLGLCPSEVGPALREQYTDQSEDGVIFVGMQPMVTNVSNIDVFIFAISYYPEGGEWLCACCFESVKIWNTNDRFVFVLPEA